MPDMLTDHIVRIQRQRLNEIAEGRTVPVFVERPYDTSPTFVGFATPAFITAWQWLSIYKLLASRSSQGDR